MWEYVIFALLFVSQCHAFNVDVYEPIVRESIQTSEFDFGDQLNKDMFGYQVVLYDSSTGPRIVVGAPRGSARGAPPNVGIYNLSYGAVYDCPVDNGTCGGFPNVDLYDTRDNALTEQKNGQLLGATIKVGGSGLLVCAPRYFRVVGITYHPIGKCYHTYDRTLGSSFRSYGVCESRGILQDHLVNSACGTGYGAAIVGENEPTSSSGEGSRISFGLPGVGNWDGDLFVYHIDAAIRGVRADFNDMRLGRSPMLGYAVAHYRQFAGRVEPSTVVSAPRANNLRGFIAFYTTIVSNVLTGPVQTINGRTIGSSFGASLAAVDFNADGVDEIVVGAPTYSEGSNINIGQIHIYMNLTNEYELFRTINGMELNAEFGYALSALGDIDDNGFEDLAVSAPFGTGSGTVFIYSGIGGSEVIRQTQVIRGNELNLVSPPPRSFGFSLSNGLDVDGNEYPDFVVGSYLSQRVYLLRSRPVVNMSLTLQFDADILDLDMTPCDLGGVMYSCVGITARFSYTGGVNTANSLSINYEFVIERRTSENVHFSRGLFSNNQSMSSGSVSVMKGAESMVQDMIHFRNDAEDIYTPISVEFFMSLDEPSIAAVNGTAIGVSSMLSSGDVLRVVGDNSTQIRLVRNCGMDGMCIADLQIGSAGSLQYEVDGTVDDGIDSIIAGVVTAVQVPLRLSNEGDEVAVQPIVSFNLPQGTRFIRAFSTSSGLAQVCTETNVSDTTQVECEMGLSFPTMQVTEYIFRIQTRGINGSEGTFNVTFEAKSFYTDEDPSDNSHDVSFTVTATADVFIQSSFRPDSVQIGRSQPSVSTVSEASELGPMVQGQFVVRNAGPSLVPTLELQISWPSMSDSDDRFIIYPSTISVDSDDVTCDMTNIDPRNYNNDTDSRRKRQGGDNEIDCATGHAVCVPIICFIANLRANESSTIRIEGFVDDTSFVGTSALWRFIASSQVIIGADYITQPNDHQSDSDSASLLGIPPNLSTDSSDDGVEAWVIIVPIVVGIIVIVVAFILLYFFGFFKRKKVGEDEQDLAWETPDNNTAGGETIQKSQSPEEEPNTQRYSNTD